MIIRHYEKMSFTPALPLAVEAWHHMLTEKLCPKQFMLQWDHQALVAFKDEKPIGIITFSKVDWNKELFINMGYVRADHRRSGVYMKLWKALVKKAREWNMHHISGSTKVKNFELRAAAKKQGRIEDGIHLMYVLLNE